MPARFEKASIGMCLVLALFVPGPVLLAQDISDVEELTQQVGRLYDTGKYAEAIPLAEQLLALKEKNRGPDHPETATVLNNLAILYRLMGQYQKAEPLFQRALAIRERVLGPDHPETANSLSSIAALYQAEGTYQKAEPLLQRALAISEKALGPDHPDTTNNLNSLGILYEAEGAYLKAEPLFRRALAIRERTLGPDHLATANSLNNLASLYRVEGAYPKAEPLFRRALAIRERALGPDHPDTAASLNNLAILYQSEGDYQEAEPLFQRSMGIVERALGPDNPAVATNLNNLAYLYRAEGAYQKAEPLYQRALAIRERALGANHPDTAYSLSNLAELYYLQGAYTKAEPLHQRALSIRERALGPNHPATAASLNNLATLYQSEGAYQKSEPLFQRALDIMERVLGPNHPDTATALSNLGHLYRAEEAYQKAEPFYRRALAIQEKALGPDHPATAVSANNLAELFASEGRYQEAEPLYQRVLAIRERALGPDRPDTADILDNLAELYSLEREYQKAEPLFQRALGVYEKALGPDYPGVGKNLNNLAGLYQKEGAYEKAQPLYQRALAIQEKVLGPDHPDTLLSLQNLSLLYCQMGDWRSAAAIFPNLIGNQRDRWDLSFGRDSQRQYITDMRESFIATLHAGSLVTDQRRVYLPMLLQTILASKARVTEEERVVLDVMKERGTAEDRALTQQLEDAVNHISDLNRRSETRPLGRDREERQEMEQKESDLRAMLSVRSAEFRPLAKEPSAPKIASLLRDRVLVELLRTREFHPGANAFGDSLYVVIVLFPDGHIDAAELGPARPIDELIAAYRQAQEVIDNREQALALAGQLGDAILRPIAKLAGSRTEWWVASDGDIRLLPLNALRLNGKYAVEDYKIWPIGSGRDLLTLDSRPRGLADDLIVANPDFGKGTAFTALPETEDEAEALSEVLPNARIVDPANRTKAFLLNLKTPPRILHLSTHAFYHPGEGDPTLRSGIALNGANLGPDGILTAKEAQTLRLNGTQLVVMSACDTGVGEVSFGDGIVGLQRSLTLAGARAQMLTEWPVSSVGTQEFMVRFYSKLAAGRTKGDAWIETQREMIAEGVSPHYWAPFVLYGDPGPLGEK